MKLRNAADAIAGILLVCITFLVICKEWSVLIGVLPVLPVLVVLVVTILFFQVRITRKAFVAVACILTLALAMTDSDWLAIAMRGCLSAAFIGAFFCALSTLRNAAQSSPAIQEAGRFLSTQPPGRRYAALTVGGQMFALLLNYGAIQLLGSLAMANANAEPNAEVRAHRTRRMLLAIQRGFISTLPWSPLSFSIAITTTLIHGTSWATVVLPGLVTSLIVAGVGWALDTIFKPKLTVAPPRTAPQGTWWSMAPLVLLLAILVVSVAVLYPLTGVRVVGIVALVVPCIALGWLFIQYADNRPLVQVPARIVDYIAHELPAYRGELILLMMAGYIGTVGAQLLVPIMGRLGLDLSAIPPWLLLVSLVWFMPLCGQFGMNPILAFTLIAPIVPEAHVLGVSPTAIVVAATAGWTLTGASSPFTATTLLTGSFAGISALRVGLSWNGAYTLICALALSLWVLIYAFAF